MTIEIIDKDGETITNLELPSNPYMVGQTIDISIINYDKEYWNVKDVRQLFKIDKIEHYVRVDYQMSGERYENAIVSVEVSKVVD